MELRIHKKPSPLKVFDKVSKLKRILKPIKIRNNYDFIQKIIDKPQEILSLLCEGYSIQDDEYVDLQCEIKSNIPISFGAHFHKGANCWLIGEKISGESLQTGYETSEELKNSIVEILESIILPEKIIFTELLLTQKVMNSKSEFKFMLNE